MKWQPSRLAKWIAAAACMVGMVQAVAQSPGVGLDDLATLKQGRSMRSSSCDPDWRNGNADARPIPPGETLVLGELEGPGVIRHIWNTIAANEMGYSRLLVLRMYWDGEDHPSVECPIGDFFGVGHGVDKSFISQPVRVSSGGRARNCYWPMPFRKSARITVTNEGRQPIRALYWYVDWQKLPSLPEDTVYLHAMYRQEFPTTMGQNYLLADIEGRGHYVGTVLSVRQHQASWWGEGDDFFFIDGEAEPSIRGTGSEDYFCDAWGLRALEGPYYGVSVFEGFNELSRTTCYRWHIPDPVCFTKSLRVEIEHKGVGFKENGEVNSGFEERSDDFSSVAFWYQLEPHKAYTPLPPAYDRVYYDPENMVEMEDFVPKAAASAGEVLVQKLGGCSGGAQLFWTPDTPEETLSIEFDVAEDGVYEALVCTITSFDYGVFVLEVDDQPLAGPLDLYSSGISSGQYPGKPLNLKAGTHRLVVKNVGKNSASQGFYFGLDGIILAKGQ